MPRVLFAVLAVVLVLLGALRLGGFLHFDAPDRATALQTLIDDYSKRWDKALQDFQAAKSKMEQNLAIDARPNLREYVDKALQIAEVNITDQTALKALDFGLSITRGSDERVVNMLSDHHAQDPQMKGACRLGANLYFEGKLTPAYASLLKKILEQNPNKQAQGLACICLAMVARDQGENGDAAANSEAEKLAERAIHEFPSVELDSTHSAADMGKIVLFAVRNLAVGKTPPDIESQDLKGRTVHLKDYRGKVVVLDIWATWCGPCKQMIPHERSMVKKLKDESFVLVSVSADEKSDDVVKYKEFDPMPWIHWWDGPRGNLHQTWNIRYYPNIYVLDAQGVVRYRNVRDAELESAVEKLLAEMKK